MHPLFIRKDDEKEGVEVVPIERMRKKRRNGLKMMSPMIQINSLKLPINDIYKGGNVPENEESSPEVRWDSTSSHGCLLIVRIRSMKGKVERGGNLFFDGSMEGRSRQVTKV